MKLQTHLKFLKRLGPKKFLSLTIARKLPPSLKCHVAVDVLRHSTTGEYSNTSPTEITAIEALNRYALDHKVK